MLFANIDIHNNNDLINIRDESIKMCADLNNETEEYQTLFSLKNCVDDVLFNRENLKEECFEHAYYELRLRQILYNTRKSRSDFRVKSTFES